MSKWGLLGVLIALLWSASASAHLTPNSEVRLTFEAREVVADVVIPQGEYAYATGASTDGSPGSRAAAAHYLAANMAVTAPDGRPWQVAVVETRFETVLGPPDLAASIRLTPPPGAPVDRLRFEWHAVTREVPTHFALLVEGGDITGRASADRRLIGTLTDARPALMVESKGGGGLVLLVSSFLLGARHILEGYDHLLFLLALLIPAPLLAAGKRWGEGRPLRATVRHIAWIVTGFTVGHSVTLIAATLLDAQLPVAPVESAIALSVLVSALHAARPIFPGREAQVAMGFGLVHGLAFATLVGNLGVARGNRAEAILGFNLGIEAVQLMIVAVCLPAILRLANAQAAYRIGAASLIGIAASGWLIERVFGIDLAFGQILDVVLPWLLGAVAVSSLVVLAGGLSQVRPRLRAG